MSFLGRVIRAAFALVLAIPCGALVLGIAVALDPVSASVLTDLGLVGMMRGLTDLASGLGPEAMLLLVTALARAAFVLLVIPPLAMAVLGEIVRLRGLLPYSCGTGLLTALVPWLLRGAQRSMATPRDLALQNLADEGRITAILFLSGAASGMVYAMIAARPSPMDVGRGGTG